MIRPCAQLAVSLGISLLLASAATAQESPTLLITHANVLDGLDSVPKRGQTIVVTGRTITRITDEPVATPAGAMVLDVRGAWIVPGLMDAHSHVNDLAGVRRALESGVTTIRTAGVGGYEDIAIRELVRSGQLPGPDMLATGVYVQPDVADAVLADERLFPLIDGVRTEEAIQRLVRVNLDHGVDWMKTRGTERAGRPDTDPREQVYSERELQVIVAEARRGGVAIMAHAHGDEGIRAAVLAGVRSIEHGTFATEATLRLMRERGTYLVPTLSSISSFGQPGDYADPRLFLRGQFMAPRRRAVVQRAYELGIPVVTGVDTNYGPESYARVSREVGFFVELGISSWDALRAATSLAAELFGIAERTGAIRPGLEADLIVVDRNPLEDVGVLQDVLVVITNGQVAVDRRPKTRDRYDQEQK